MKTDPAAALQHTRCIQALTAIGICTDSSVIQRAVKPLPSGGGYKAHLNWNFDFPAFVC